MCDAVDVQIAHDFDFAFGGIEERIEEEDAGIIDEKVDFDAVFVAKSEAFVGGVVLREVGGECLCGDATRLFDGLGGFGECTFIDVDEDEVKTALCARKGKGASNARGRARDECPIWESFYG